MAIDVKVHVVWYSASPLHSFVSLTGVYLKDVCEFQSITEMSSQRLRDDWHADSFISAKIVFQVVPMDAPVALVACLNPNVEERAGMSRQVLRNVSDVVDTRRLTPDAHRPALIYDDTQHSSSLIGLDARHVD